MRLPCEVSVLSRLLPTAGLRGPGRAARAVLSLGKQRQAGAAGGVWLLVSTARDRPGTKYQVRGRRAGEARRPGPAPPPPGQVGNPDAEQPLPLPPPSGALGWGESVLPLRGPALAGEVARVQPDTIAKLFCPISLRQNIEQLFTKFVEEGKATIRLKEPSVDVCLSKANASLLKTFLSAVKLANQGSSEETLPLSALVAPKASEVEKPKTRMTITSRKEYPLTRSFPYSLEHLQASYCKLARIDMRMLCLKSLRKLDLSHNCIKKLPATIGDLVCLQELNLHNNHLEVFNVALCSSTLRKSLQSLDLSQNKIKALPAQFCQLQELVRLKLDDNDLIRLPFKIGRLRQLRFLSAARNKLLFLPDDFAKLSLENLDLFGNPFEQPRPLVPDIQLKIPLTLLEYSARATVDFRIPYGHHVLPSHLCDDLDMSKTCQCGRACLSCFIQTTVTMNLHSVAHTVVLVDNMGGTEAPAVRYFCSLTCYSQFLDRHLQSIQ